jgi:hypothetical protein
MAQDEEPEIRAQLNVDSESVIITPDVALAHFSAQTRVPTPVPSGRDPRGQAGGAGEPGQPGANGAQTLPTRFLGTVMISADRPARDIHQIVEAIVEQLTTLPGSDVSLKLEIDGLKCLRVLIAGRFGPCSKTRRRSASSQDGVLGLVDALMANFWSR